MAHRFLGKEIQVTTAGELRHPVAFVLEGQEHAIQEVLAAWPDHGFGSSPPIRKRWWLHHHRNYYRVRTATGEVFEIYYDRGVSLKASKYKKWYASRQLDPSDGQQQDVTP